MRRTRILTTLGPATDTPEAIRALLDAGTDAFRLNFSHGDEAAHIASCRRIREAQAAAGRPVAILQDLAGPKMRIGPVAQPLPLVDGDRLVIARGRFMGGAGRVSSSADALFTSVTSGVRLLLDDGRIELEVVSVTPDAVTTRVITGGVLDGHKGINVPAVPLRIPALTPKDRNDLRTGIAMGVDLIAVSFVQSADDVASARAAAAAEGAPDLPIIAKIERPQAVADIDNIVRVADGLMVARGDLGIEVPLETVPTIQRRLVLAARRAAIPVIVATQVLESMRYDPRPTRAEVTDAAHAVEEGADAIMLAGETAVGRYPVRAVATLAAILREAERVPGVPLRVHPDPVAGLPHGLALCEAAVALADRAQAAAIVALTEAGRTARQLASLRPAARIIAATPHTGIAARLSLVWGVTPVVTDDATTTAVRRHLLERGLVPAGSAVVFVSMHPTLTSEQSNFVHVETV
jgi:pyruvate kinase